MTFIWPSYDLQWKYDLKWYQNHVLKPEQHYYVNAFHDEFSWLDFTNDKFHEIEFHIAKELKEGTKLLSWNQWQLLGYDNYDNFL